MTASIRRRLYAIIDTETANGLNCPLMYNIAVMIIDCMGNVYAKLNFIINDVFFSMDDLMQSAYYAHKIPQYMEQLERGEIEAVSMAEASARIHKLISDYNVKIWMAHNARFDNKSMNTTERYLTKSKYRYFLPYGMTAYDTMKMAQDVIATKPSYRKFCEENGFMTKHKTPRPQVKAETIYRFITNDPAFIEEHKAFEDIDIERQIFAYCNRQHKKMRRELWENA